MMPDARFAPEPTRQDVGQFKLQTLQRMAHMEELLAKIAEALEKIAKKK